MTPSQNPLTAIFSPTRRLLVTDQLLLRGGLAGGTEWVVPRAQCQYLRFEFQQVPRRRRAAALRLALERHLPAPSAIAHWAWTDAVAHVWYWLSPSAGFGDGGKAWVPESRLRQAALSEGARLMALSQGFEGQLWHEGKLASSQWWPVSPALNDWIRFLRASGVDATGVSHAPTAQAVGWVRQAWGRSPSRLLDSPARQERFAWMASAMILAAALGWQLSGWRQWRDAEVAMSQRLAEARKRAAPVQEAQRQASLAVDDANELLALQAYAINDHALMVHMLDRLPEGARFRSWTRESNRLKVAIDAPDANPRDYVSALEGVHGATEVIATPADGGLLLELTLPSPPAEDEEEGP